MTTYTQSELDAMLATQRNHAEITARFIRPFAGGLAANDKGLEAFVQFQMKLEPGTPDFEQALARIKKEEIGERDTTPETGEVKTEEVYGVNIIRRTERGPYVAEHQIKALLKQAASRLGLFKAKGKVGSKGDLAEMGTIKACGDSLQDPERPWEIYLRKDGRAAETEYVLLSGRVNTPSGAKSIQHHTETAEEGATITFSIDWPDGKLKADDMALVIAAATQIGLGSCLSLGYGRFEATMEC